MEHTKNILIIGDMPGYGKMGLAGMLPILSNMGHSVYNLPTALVSNNFDYGKFSVLDTTAYMEETIRVWQTLGFQFDCITTGFLASAAQVDLLRAFIDSQRKADFLVVTDPIMGDGGKLYNGSTPQTVDNMRRFVGAADVIVPNLTEAEFLTGLYKGEELLTGAQARRILDGLRALGPRSAVITSGREEGAGMWSGASTAGPGNTSPSPTALSRPTSPAPGTSSPPCSPASCWADGLCPRRCRRRWTCWSGSSLWSRTWPSGTTASALRSI